MNWTICQYKGGRMKTIYQVVTTSGVVKATFVFLDDAQEYIKTKEPLCRILPLDVWITEPKRGEKNE
jgi:hypothetical protein